MRLSRIDSLPSDYSPSRRRQKKILSTGAFWPAEASWFGEASTRASRRGRIWRLSQTQRRRPLARKEREQMLFRQASRLPGLIGAAFGALLFASSAQSHECRALGQAQNEDIGQYWICVGFAVEDGDRPRAGTLNNLDFIPYWAPGNPHAHGVSAPQH
ncbi:MAG: hypothetical protein N2444_08240, partial [Methylocystis sp.]|nr:hypothetical protein [Methylocystis sp.]